MILTKSFISEIFEIIIYVYISLVNNTTTNIIIILNHNYRFLRVSYIIQ